MGKRVSIPAQPNFDENTIALLDKHQGVFTDAQLIQLAKILKLDTAPQSATVMEQRVQEEAPTSTEVSGPGTENSYSMEERSPF